MGVTKIIQSIKFLTEFKNDVGFGSNLSDTTPNLTGSVMENVKTVQRLELGWRSEEIATDVSDPSTLGWTVTVSGSVVVVTSNTTSFDTNDGWSVGDAANLTVVASPGGTFAFPNGVVTFVSGQTLVITTNIPPAPPPALNTLVHIIIESITVPTALIYNFGVLGNGEVFNDASKVSGNSQGFYASNIGTSFVNMQRLGNYNDWITGSARVKRVGASGFNNIYEIEHSFTIVPYFLDGEIQNLQNDILTPLFQNGGSLKYAFNAGFRTSLSNPSSQTDFTWSNTLGSVGWFNRNYNGFNNDYTIDSVVYTDSVSGGSATGIIIGGLTNIEIICSNINVFLSNERYGLYISYLPEQNEYQNTTLTNLKENFLYDSVVTNVGTPGSGQDFIQSVSASIISGKLVINCIVEYSLLQKSFLSNKFAQNPIKFLLAVQLGDNTLSNASSNKVMLLADVEDYDQSSDIPDLMDVSKFRFHPYDVTIGSNTGFTDLTEWNEDGFVIDFDFSIDRNKDAFINSLEFKLVAYNSTTGQFFELDSYSFNVASVVSGGIQQIIENTTRGYNLLLGDQFNDVIIGVGTNTSGIQSYIGRFSQKTSWQDWIQNLSVDTVFFDNTKPNDNLNLKSSNYSSLNGYDIKVAIASNLSGVSVFGVSGITDYLFLSPPLKVYDYDLDGNITPVWSATIETFNPVNNTNLNGAVMVGSPTLFRTTFVNSSGPVSSLTDTTAIHRIEEVDQNGYNIDELGTLYSYPLGNRVIPKTGLTNLEMLIVSGNIITECLVDGNQLINGISYNLSSKLLVSSNTVAESKLEEDGTVKNEEDGTIKLEE